MNRALHIVWLMGALLAAASACAGETAAESERPDAPAILARCRAMLPEKPLTLAGSIVLRTRKGFVQGEYDFSLMMDRTKVPARVALAFYKKGTSNVLEKVEVTRPGKVPEGKILETDIAWQDLTLDFLWWPEADFDPEPEQESVHGQKCDVILARDGSETVRLWADRKTGCLMQAETLSSKGKAVRRLWGTRIKRFDGRWMPNILEVETLGSGHRTKIKIEDIKES